MDTASANIRRKKRFKYILITEGIAIGLITGALISVFRLMLTGADTLRSRLADYAHSGAGAALVCALVLLAAAATVALLLGFEPDIAGSGIPQVEAELRGLRDMDWKKVIAGKMAGCALAIGGGLALGREGPSIQIGAMVGKGFAKARKSVLTEERLLLTCGAGAGLSAAFGAPLAGAIFSLEELHRNFSAEVLMTTMAAAAASDFVTANILGLTPVFGFEIEHGLPLRYYWAVVVLGLALGAFGAGYNRVIALMQDAFAAVGRGAASLVCRAAGREVSILSSSDEVSPLAERASRFGRMITVFAAAYLFMFMYPDVLGSGSGLVSRVCSGEFAVPALALLLILKFVFSTASFGSG